MAPTSEAEAETVESLVLDLLEWVGSEARPYAEVMEAWRTSCPRLPVWEEANGRGFLERRHQPGRGELVCVSTSGARHLRSRRPPPAPVRRRESLGIDQEYLRESQYKDPTNLDARIALHTKYTRADEPWYPWLVGRIDWPVGARVLEVGCGTGALWANVAPLLPDLRRRPNMACGRGRSLASRRGGSRTRGRQAPQGARQRPGPCSPGKR